MSRRSRRHRRACQQGLGRPVQYHHNSEPYMRIAVAGNLPAAGVAIADVNLKLIWDVVAAIRIGETGHAIVVDDSGRLIAHPDISRVLRGGSGSGDFSRIKHLLGATSSAAVVIGDTSKPVLAFSVHASDAGWTVIAMQPVLEAFAPIRAALWRSLILIVLGMLIALALAYWRAHRMSGPIKQLERGAERVGHGQFDSPIMISSGDELQQLAIRFNEMTLELAASQQKSERINRLKQFLAPEVDRTGRALRRAARRATARRRRGVWRFARLHRLLRARGSRRHHGRVARIL